MSESRRKSAVITSTRVPPSHCLNCGKMVDATTSVSEGGPQPGNITVCWTCGHIMAFANDLTLRKLSDEEMHAVAGDPLLIAIQKLRKMRNDET
jgi:hypothetical protein